MVCLFVYPLVTFMGPAETDERIEMPFGWVTRVAQGTMCWMLSRSPQGKGQFWEVVRPIEKHWVTAAVCAANKNQ